jgi:hypothetical protein
MKTNRYEVGYLLLVCVLAICAFACNGNGTTPEAVCVDGAGARSEGCDEFARESAIVRKNGVIQGDNDWHPLATNDTLVTDDNGEAELNFSDCWPGQLWLFGNTVTEIGVRDCRKSEFDEISNLCVPDGTLFSGKCLGEFSVSTASVRLTKLGSSFTVTALPGNRDISLVVVLEGAVKVEPVLSFDPTRLGEGSDVVGGEFYFTMPDAMLSDVAGFPPRRLHSVSDLYPVVRELGIEPWIGIVGERAESLGVLPDNWPRELVGPGVTVPPEPGWVVSMGGGELNDTRIQEALVRAVDWSSALKQVADGVGTVTAQIGDKPVDVIKQLPYDPELSKALLDEAGYRQQGVTVMFPTGDEQLGEAAKWVMEYLGGMGIEVVLKEGPGDELGRLITSVRATSGRPVMILSR